MFRRMAWAAAARSATLLPLDNPVSKKIQDCGHSSGCVVKKVADESPQHFAATTSALSGGNAAKTAFCRWCRNRYRPVEVTCGLPKPLTIDSPSPIARRLCGEDCRRRQLRRWTAIRAACLLRSALPRKVHSGFRWLQRGELIFQRDSAAFTTKMKIRQQRYR